MPNVPDISVGVTPLQGLPNARFNTEAPLEAFGGGASLEGVDRAVQGLGNAAADIARQEKEKADQLAVMSASRKAMELQTQLQVKASQMRGRDALGAPDMVDKEWQGSVAKITQGLANDEQRLAFAHYASSAYGELNKSTSLHVAGQIREFDENETQSLLDTSRNAAVLNAYDTKRVGDELDKQSMALETWAGRNGIPTDSQQFKDRLLDTKSKTLTAVIEQRLASGQDKAAQELFADSKDSLSAADTVALQHKIEATKTLQTSFDTWQKVKGLRLANGDPDEARMQSAVMSNPDLSNEQKLKVLDFVQAQAKIEAYERRAHDAANERGISNAAIKAKQSGVPLSDALKLVNNYAKDATDTARMTNLVQRLYEPPAQTDPRTYLNLWQGIQSGDSSQKPAIEAAFDKHLINAKDYLSLSEQDFKSQQEGKDPATKYVWEAVQKQAKATISDETQYAEFMGQFARQMQGKTPEQIQQAWKEQQSKPTGWFQDPVWKGTVNQVEKDAATWAPIYSQIGKDQARLIGSSLKKTGWTAKDIAAFADEFGGMKNIAVGTPENNAILSLSRRTDSKGNPIPVVPENIRALLQRYPDGKY